MQNHPKRYSTIVCELFQWIKHKSMIELQFPVSSRGQDIPCTLFRPTQIPTVVHVSTVTWWCRHYSESSLLAISVSVFERQWAHWNHSKSHPPRFRCTGSALAKAFPYQCAAMSCRNSQPYQEPQLASLKTLSIRHQRAWWWTAEQKTSVRSSLPPTAYPCLHWTTFCDTTHPICSVAPKIFWETPKVFRALLEEVHDAPQNRLPQYKTTHYSVIIMSAVAFQLFSGTK